MTNATNKTYTTKSNALRAAKAAHAKALKTNPTATAKAFDNAYRVTPCTNADGKPAFTFVSLATEAPVPAYARDRSAHAVPMAWQALATATAKAAKPATGAKPNYAAAYATVRKATMQALIANGLNVHTARAQAYRFGKWLHGEWQRPVTLNKQTHKLCDQLRAA